MKKEIHVASNQFAATAFKPVHQAAAFWDKENSFPFFGASRTVGVPCAPPSPPHQPPPTQVCEANEN